MRQWYPTVKGLREVSRVTEKMYREDLYFNLWMAVAASARGVTTDELLAELNYDEDWRDEFENVLGRLENNGIIVYR